METPFFGGTYSSLSSNLAADRCMNIYPEQVETKQGKEIGGFYSTPGQKHLLTFANSGSGFVSGPMRGIRATANKKLVAVFGNQVVQADINNNVTALGHLNTASGPVSIIDNGLQYAVFDGFQGWSWNGSTWAQITTIPNFPTSATIQDGFGVVSIAGTNQFYQSNLDDLTTWDPLNFSSADADPFNIQAIISLFRQLWVVKEKSIEIWNNAGLNGFVFQRMQGAYVNVGCVAPYSVVTSEDHVFWLGQSNQGSLQVYMNNGYMEQRISTHAVEYEISSYVSQSSIGIADAIGFGYTQAGHIFYVLSFPSGNATWVYDLTENLWHERGEFLDGAYNRWDPSCYAFFNKQHVVGSSTAQQLSTLDLLYPTDDIAASLSNNPKRWMRRWRALKQPVHAPIRIGSLKIDMQTGILLGGGEAGNGFQQMNVKGSLGNGTYNSLANFSYTIQSTFTVTNVVVTSGALPTGLSLSSNGVITGTFSAVGSFSWQITATDIFGNTATLNDSCSVTYMVKGLWGLMSTASGTSIWFGPSPAAFPISASLTNGLLPNGNANSKLAWTGSSAVYGGGISVNQVSLIPNQTFIASLSNSVMTTGSFGAVIRYFSGILFQCNLTGGGGGNYEYSTDNGHTWQSGTSPVAGSFLRDITQLSTGTWIAYFQLGATQNIYYSNQTIPTVWTLGMGIPSGTGCWALATDGTSAMALSNTGSIFTSTNGSSWTSGTFPESISTPENFTISGGGLGQFVAQANANGAVWTTSNTGSSWTQYTPSSASSQANNIGYYNGTFFATFPNATQGIVYSLNGGSIWNVSTLPSGFSGSPLLGAL